MRIKKNKLTVFFNFLLLFLFFVISLLTGCVNPVDGPPPDKSAPSITVYSPLSNDTVYLGEVPINYQANDDNGLSHFEVYINDTLANTFEQPQDSSNIKIYLNVGKNRLHKTISYYLAAYDLSGNKTISSHMRNILVDELKLPPAAPGNLTLNKITDKIFNLVWTDESEDEEHFELWRKEDTSSFKLIRNLPKNSISTNDTISFPNLPYSYKIKASNSNGSSESNIVTTLPDASGLTQVPSNLNGTAYGANRIKLTWRDNSNNELAFKIERKISSSNTYELVAFTNANDTVYYDTAGLFATTDYTYRIAAVGQFGLSNWSNTTTVTTLSHDVNPPENLQIDYDSTKNVVVLTWKDNSIFDIETLIERSGPNKKFTQVGIVGENVTTFSDSTVSKGQRYFYRIRSHTIDGYFSEYTTEIEISL